VHGKKRIMRTKFTIRQQQHQQPANALSGNTSWKSASTTLLNIDEARRTLASDRPVLDGFGL
jgi:hypothetical protein